MQMDSSLKLETHQGGETAILQAISLEKADAGDCLGRDWCFGVPAPPAFKFSQFICSVVSNSLQSHGLQHAWPPCPSPTPRVHSNSCPFVGDAIQPSHPLSSPSQIAAFYLKGLSFHMKASRAVNTTQSIAPLG